MTTKPANPQPGARRLPPLPDPPRKTDMQEYTRFDMLAEANTLARRFDAQRADSSILVSGKGYLCQRRSDLPRAPYPDLVVAFGVDAAAIVDNNGYDISEVGKPPELVLEIASSSTGRNDYIGKRVIYAGFGVREYWRFDATGGRYHDAPLGADRLTPAGVYQPIELHTEANGVIWGYSQMLSLSLCWVEGRLRFWDRSQGAYLLDPSEEQRGRITEAARADAEAARADAEAARADAEAARADAEAARVLQLEEELCRLRANDADTHHS